MSFSLRPSTPPASLIKSKYALAPVTVSVPRKCDGPSKAEQEPIKISFSVTPGTPCACAGEVATSKHPEIKLSPPIDFRMRLIILPSVGVEGPGGENFSASCLVWRRRDV